MRRSAIRTLGGLEILGYNATIEELKGFLKKGRKADGRPITQDDVDLYDHRSNKPLSELLSELNNREAFLVIDEDGRIVRRSTTVKIILINPEADMYLAELLHVYKIQFFVVDKAFLDRLEEIETKKSVNPRFSYSETMILGETERETVVRCLAQEAKLGPSDYQIEPPIRNSNGNYIWEDNCHESQAYEYLISYETISAVFTVYTTALKPGSKVIYVDNGKLSLRMWRPCLPINSKLTIGQLRELGHDI